MNDKQNDTNNLVWSYVGEWFKRLDNERMIAIAQNNPNYFMSQIAQKEAFNIIDLLKENNYQFNNKILKLISESNLKDNAFRETAKYLNQSDDKLSAGSFITGNIVKEGKLAEMIIGNKKNGDK